MNNLSETQRKRHLEFINTLKKDASPSDLILLNELEDSLYGIQYGINWEKYRENKDEELINFIPYFEEVADLSIQKNEKNKINYFLEGDNLHSLYLLQKTHLKKVDVIYIDPPYNTGNTFIYNDQYVDDDDAYKHSKWLSFMNERMTLAKSLLSDKGVLFVSINDFEYAQLKLLLDDIFGEENHIITLPRQTKKSGKSTNSFAKNHDYVLVYTNKEKDVFLLQDPKKSDKTEVDDHFETRGKFRLNQTLDYDSLTYGPTMDFPLEVNGEVFYPGGDYEKYIERKSGNYKKYDWAWRWTREMFEFGLKNDFVVIKEYKNNPNKRPRIYTKTYEKVAIESINGEYKIVEKDNKSATSSLEFTNNEYSNDNAKKDLKRFNLASDFDYPKPVELIKKLIMTYNSKDAVVLDFFAGSATTAEAVLRANETDGGERTFIVCTNDEGEIPQRIAYPRIKEIIEGYYTNGKRSIKLFEEKLTLTKLKKAENYLKEIDDIVQDKKNEYSKIRKTFVDNTLTVYGDINTKKFVPATNENLKYYKVEFISRATDESLKQLLNSHIIPLIELQYGVDFKTNEKYKVFLNEDDLDKYFNSNSIVDGTTLFVPDEVLVTNAQKESIFQKNLGIIRIPNYYYNNELLESGAI